MSDSTENKQRKPNSWLEHVKSVREKNPDVIYKEALKLAKESYQPVEKPQKAKRVSKEKRNVRTKKPKNEELESELVEAY